MKELSVLKLNVIMEKLYVESAINEIFTDIANFKEEKKLVMETQDKSIFKKIIDDLGLTRRLIFTFSTGVSAMVGPVNSLLAGSGVNLSETEIIMLIISAIASMTGEGNNQTMIQKLKEKGLYEYLNDVTEFIINVKDLINSITKKVLKATYSLTEILGFTFLMVPVMNVLNKLIQENGINLYSIKQLFFGLLASSVTFGVKNVIDTIRKRLR
jgi:hypothetical protein